MKKKLVGLLLGLAGFAGAQIVGPFSDAVNIAGDLVSVPDNQPGVFGGAVSYASRIQFNQVPAGYRVRILYVYGDFIAMPRGIISPGTSLEVGWGLKTTAPDGSLRVTFPGYSNSGFDNSFVWRQDILTSANQGLSLHYDYDTSTGGLLGTDNILISQMFLALDTAHLTIHLEPTMVITYQYEPEPATRPVLPANPRLLVIH